MNSEGFTWCCRAAQWIMHHPNSRPRRSPIQPAAPSIILHDLHDVLDLRDALHLCHPLEMQELPGSPEQTKQKHVARRPHHGVASKNKPECGKTYHKMHNYRLAGASL